MRSNILAFGVEILVALAFASILLKYFAAFFWKLYHFTSSHLGLTSVLVLLYAMVYAQVGTGLGIQHLFWHEDFPVRVGAAFAATLLLALLGVIAFYLDPYPWATEEVTEAWLGADESMKRSLAAFWSRRLNTPLFRRPWWKIRCWVGRLAGSSPTPEEPVPLAEPRSMGPPKLLGVACFWADGLAFDWISISPIQICLEPRGSNQLRIQRFLRTCRMPFLLLLLAPALLPDLFIQVPRVAPTGGLWEDPPPIHAFAPRTAGYLLGALAWWLGIAAGVAAIKVMIKASECFDLGSIRGPSHRRRGGGRALGRWTFRFGTIDVSGRPEAVQINTAELEIEEVHARAERPEWVQIDRRCPLAAHGCATGGCPRGEPVPGAQPASRCLARRQSQYSVRIFIAFFLGFYVVIARVPYLYREWVSPAFAICATLGVLAMGVAMLDLVPRWVQRHYPAAGFRPRMVQLPMVLLLIFWLGFANNSPYKYRFEGLLYDDAKLVDLRERVDRFYFDDPPEPDAIELVSDEEAREAWARNIEDGDKDRVADRRPKMVLVAVSGGAARSAYWTAVVLDRLQRNMPEFGRRVRIISGASGGMLGTAYFVKHLHDEATKPAGGRQVARGGLPSDWVKGMPLDSMSPLAKHIALSEIWWSLWPGNQVDDRGIVLERNWVDLRFPLRGLAKLEREGKIPSLIFSPMMVEDGRRLLISNLDLSPVPRTPPAPGRFATSIVKAKGRRISRTPPTGVSGDTGTNPEDYSLSGMEFFRLFPESQSLLLSTAVRMSATFPFVSPAVNLPTNPPRRVVDAGYYDNYGVQVAVAWIRQNRAWLGRNTSGVLLVQIRDSASVRERLDIDDSIPGPGSWAHASRGFQFLTSPIDGFTQARFTSSSFRNDDDVEGLSLMFAEMMTGEVERPESFFATAIFENSALVTLGRKDFWAEVEELTRYPDPGSGSMDVSDVTMTWNLTRAEREATRLAIPEGPADGSRWRSEATRSHAADALAGQVFNTMSERTMEEYGARLASLESREVAGTPVAEFRRKFDAARKEYEAAARNSRTSPTTALLTLKAEADKWEELLIARQLDASLRGAKVPRNVAMRDELRKAGLISFGPGPERDIRFKRLEQLRNYAQLENLAIWWERSGKRTCKAPTPGSPPASLATEGSPKSD